MDISIGKKRRLERIISNNKTLVVPVDDSLIFGPKNGLYNIEETLKQILHCNPSAILGFQKDLEISTKISSHTPFIYNLTASTVLNSHTKKVIVSSVENAVLLGADCVAAHINFTSAYESDMIQNFAYVSNECHKYGMPLLAISYPRSEFPEGGDNNYKDLKENAPDAYTSLVSHCTRIAVELGADIVKTNYTGSVESFSKVVESACNVPVIIAGGPKITVEESLTRAANVMKAGGAGISYGRNVFNADHIVPYLLALKTIVFENAPASDAINLYNKLLEEK